ncbi:MAG TPA: pseudouridine synthase [Polyangiaceae bacterium]
MPLERLQKLLARAGISSRRKAEELIVRGRVSVDGRIVSELGARADSRKSRIEVDGKRIVAEDLVYGVLHKPRGTVCTLSDPEGRPTIAELLRDVGARVVPVGRLDYHTSGVLLFTNDGDFASALQHAKTGAPKVYVAKVHGSVDERVLARFKESIVIDGRPTRPAEARVLRHEGDKCWLEFSLKEGKNRQIRRLGEHADSPILRLVRTEQAGITIEGLRPGNWRFLTVDELAKLKKQYGVPKRVRRPPDPSKRREAAAAAGRRPKPGAPAPRRPQSGAPGGRRTKPSASGARGANPSVPGSRRATSSAPPERKRRAPSRRDR